MCQLSETSEIHRDFGNTLQLQSQPKKCHIILLKKMDKSSHLSICCAIIYQINLSFYIGTAACFPHYIICNHQTNKLLFIVRSTIFSVLVTKGYNNFNCFTRDIHCSKYTLYSLKSFGFKSETCLGNFYQSSGREDSALALLGFMLCFALQLLKITHTSTCICGRRIILGQ